MANRRSTRENHTEDNSQSISEDILEECVKYIISREPSKAPIKRMDLLKHLSTVTQTSAHQINSIISGANKILKQVYNYKLVQVEAKGGVQYIVVSSQEYPESIRSLALDVTHRRLLIAALTHIYMSGGPVKEGVAHEWSYLWANMMLAQSKEITFLKKPYADNVIFLLDSPNKLAIFKLPICMEKQNPFWHFRDMVSGKSCLFRSEDMFRFLHEAGLLEESDHATRKIFTTMFTRQMYLTYTKVDEGEISKHVFEWGQRAMEEIPKMFILQKMAEAFGESPEHWYEQYKEAKEEAVTN